MASRRRKKHGFFSKSKSKRPLSISTQNETNLYQELPSQSQSKRQCTSNSIEFKAEDNTQPATQPILIATQNTSTASTRVLQSTNKHYKLTLNREPGTGAKDQRTIQIDITWTESSDKKLFDIKHKVFVF